MDGDQQDPPKDAFNMFKLILEKNCDVVYAVRDRRKENFLKYNLIKCFIEYGVSLQILMLKLTWRI